MNLGSLPLFGELEFGKLLLVMTDKHPTEIEVEESAIFNNHRITR